MTKKGGFSFVNWEKVIALTMFNYFSKATKKFYNKKGLYRFQKPFYEYFYLDYFNLPIESQ